MQMLEDEDIPSDDSLSPAEDSPRRDYSRPLVKPQDTIVLDFGGGAPGNRSMFNGKSHYILVECFMHF